MTHTHTHTHTHVPVHVTLPWYDAVVDLPSGAHVRVVLALG